MLKSLSIQNYALISSLEVEFHQGLSAITGETGAGKSILMGALGLVLGARADSSAINDKSKKCVVEASFNIENLDLQEFFSREDLDYEGVSLLRRELLPGGKSRAFINDTPVRLPVLKNLGEKLVNIHAQHHNLILREEGFPLEIVDAFLNIEDFKSNYKNLFFKFRDLQLDIERIDNNLAKSRKEQDYLEFQYGQLDEAGIVEGEEELLAEEQEVLVHAGEIQSSLNGIIKAFSEDEINIIQLLKKSSQDLESVLKYMPGLEESGKRIESAYIELKDIGEELERLLEGVESDPERLNFITERLDLLYSLQTKHQVNSSKDLISIKNDLSKKLESISISDIELEKLKTESEEVLKKLEVQSSELRKRRLEGLSSLENLVIENLRDIGIPHADFEIRHIPLDNFDEDGKDKFSFYFSANKNQEKELVQKVASGGEISRLMLSLKSLVSETLAVPTLIFDEIDAGVSGEIADKMGKMLRRISKNRQVINVTHLPQVAGRGDFHYQVYKQDEDHRTMTDIRLLDNDGRIMEMAKMLSGEQLTQEALGNARALLHKS